MKLSRFLYHHTPHGKYEVRRILAAGRVTVDGTPETDSQREIGHFTQVTLDGELLQDETPVYIMLNKPAGYLSATTDPLHPTVLDLVDEPTTLHIAGRLDRASTGLLILTNDGKWSRQLTEPKEGVPKVYLVTTAGPITEDTHTRFARGIYFAYEDLTTQPADLEILGTHQAKITIYEGRYHQIKRMFHAVGNRITSLHRLSMGNIQLDPALEPGAYRYLTRDEVASTVAG
ncbi:MAG: 16S rRNA pseudouridine(516) synthase [Akkermansiaceae bacterium]|nr:16S rRNA pseudouridine(516) synthase [Akkermansiaceae bacterium]